MIDNFSKKTKMESSEKITYIGTANLGTNYGPNFNSKIFPKSEIYELLHRIADDPRIYIDTAIAYKNAHALIGEFAPSILNNKITTKILLKRNSDNKSVIKSIKNSLTNTKQEIFYAVMLHNTDVVNQENLLEIIDGLNLSVKLGLANHIGISCYSAEELIEIKSQFNSLDHFQLPESILNQENMNNSKLLEFSKSKNSIYVRSIFLQGLLLQNTSNLPLYFQAALEDFVNFEKYCLLNNISKPKLCIDYANSLKWAAGIVAGVSNLEEYEQLISNIYSEPKIRIFPKFSVDKTITDPRKWK
jgi:aryl-alcohol dehydrogenase-like predicted oxidoreductase